jgi:hypothetical protein
MIFSPKVGTFSHTAWSGEDSALPETPRHEFISSNNSCLQFQVSNSKMKRKNAVILFARLSLFTVLLCWKICGSTLTRAGKNFMPASKIYLTD